MFEFKLYTRTLRWPILLHGNLLAQRPGIIIRLKDVQGQYSYGEVAPLPEFGTETLQDALQACELLAQDKRVGHLEALPALQAGLSMARWREWDNQLAPGVAVAMLVRHVEDVKAALGQGYTTFKLKIGHKPMHEAFAQYCRIVEVLPKQGRLRLDVNGNWSAAEALFWADKIDAHVVEFIEQPFGVKDLPTHQKFLADTPVPIALDESVNTAKQAWAVAHQNWPGLWVIKPALWGDWETFVDFRKGFAGKIIYSSALETGLGQRAGMALACCDDGRGDWALGYGIDSFFETDKLGLSASAEAIWNAL